MLRDKYFDDIVSAKKYENRTAEREFRKMIKEGGSHHLTLQV